jgi:hypothetical protein
MDEYGHPTHEEYVAQQRSFAASVAQKVLAGEMTALEGARILSRLDGLDLDEEDEDLGRLRLVDDETEALPIGEGQAQWAPEALRAKAAELEHAELWARDVALECFRRLAERFGANKAVQPTRAAAPNGKREPARRGPRGWPPA